MVKFTKIRGLKDIFLTILGILIIAIAVLLILAFSLIGEISTLLDIHTFGFFGGLALIWFGIKFLPEPLFRKKEFVSYHCLFFLGILILLITVNHTGAFDSIDSFTLGSFALVFTGFLIASPSIKISPEEQYSILLYSVTATLVFFISGTSTAIWSIMTSFSKFVPFLGVICSSLFGLGVADIIIVSILFLRSIYDCYTQIRVGNNIVKQRNGASG